MLPLGIPHVADLLVGPKSLLRQQIVVDDRVAAGLGDAVIQVDLPRAVVPASGVAIGIPVRRAHAADATEDVGVGEKGREADQAAQRGAHDGGVVRVGPGPKLGVDRRLDGVDQEGQIVAQC